jgi:uncharacterized membrane protein YkvA (DUF1232 family)
MENNKSEFAKDYSEESFWQKVKSFFKEAGADLIFLALKLYYAAQSPKTPTWAKAVIYAALGYFICPIDVIPDTIPIVGYSDDLGVLTYALAVVAAYIDEDVVSKATAKMKIWFGDFEKKAS